MGRSSRRNGRRSWHRRQQGQERARDVCIDARNSGPAGCPRPQLDPTWKRNHQEHPMTPAPEKLPALEQAAIALWNDNEGHIRGASWESCIGKDYYRNKVRLVIAALRAEAA